MTTLALIFLAAFLAVARTADTEIKETPKTEKAPTTATTPKAAIECECEGPACYERTVKCAAADDVCFNVIETISLEADNLKFDMKTKGCAKSSNSFNGSFVLDFEHGLQMDVTSKLCYSTDCDASLEDLWIRNIANGKKCPLCYKSGQSSCTPNGTVFCRGDMINCTTISGVILEGNNKVPFAAHGCATPSVCEMVNRTSPVLFPSGDVTIQINKVTCSSSSVSLRFMVPTLGGFNLSLQVAFFFPCLLGLLTVKTFSS